MTIHTSHTHRTHIWQDDASCAQIGPADWLWYPDKGGKDIYAIKAVCDACPVQYECLNTALDTPVTDDFGVWAGVGAKGRQYLRGNNPTSIPPRQRWTITDTATPEQADAARRHATDGRSIEWIAYALRLTAPAVHAALNEQEAAA